MSASAGLPNILVIGTGDTKSDELLFMADIIARAGGLPIMVDVSVLGDPPYMPDYSKHDIAKAANTTIQVIADSGDENSAMALTESLLAGAPRWLVITQEVWDSPNTTPGAREHLEVVQTFDGLAYADGMRRVKVMVVRADLPGSGVARRDLLRIRAARMPRRAPPSGTS